MPSAAVHTLPHPDPPGTEAADAVLLARVVGGDERAIEELHQRYAGLLLALATRILGDREAAEDVVQTVFLQLWRQAESYDPGRASVSSWLSLIARSRALDRLRSRGARGRSTEAALRERAVGDRTEARGPERVLQSERSRHLRLALAELPPSQRELLELAYWQGLTQREISRSSGIPLGTVKTRTASALRTLRVALRGEIEQLL